MASAAAARVMSDSEYLELAREKLIVALDFWEIEDARKLVRDLGNEVSFYKVGLGLQLAGGDEFAKELIAQGKRVFLDYKYYDIDGPSRGRAEAVSNSDARRVVGTGGNVPIGASPALEYPSAG